MEQDSKHSEPPASAQAVVVNDSPTQLRVLAKLVETAGLQPMVYEGAEAALKGMDPSRPPALIVTDVHMPGIDGWRFCRLLRSADYAAFSEVPILVVSATFSGDEPSHIAADLGAEAFLGFPVAEERFVAQVQTILHGSKARSLPRLLIVEDSRTYAGLIQRTFAGEGYQVDVARTAKEAAEAFSKTVYDAAAIDYHLPDGKGDVLLDRFQAEHPDCVCIMMTGDLHPELSLDWMKRGAAAYVAKPFDPRYLVELCVRARRERALMRVPKLLEQRTEELQRSEERLASVLQMQQEIICRYQPDTTLTFVNPAYCRFFGKTEAELVGTSILGLLPEAQHAGVREGLLRLTAASPARTYEVSYARPDGTTAWVEWKDEALFDAEGGVQEYQSVGRDMTERKRIEEALDRRMMALIQPLDNPAGIEMEALFNLNDLQRLQDEFAVATGVASVITRVDGSPVTRPSGFTRFCTLIRSTETGRKNCLYSDAALGGAGADGMVIQMCRSGGLWDSGARITVGGRHIANWIIGQVRDETMPEEKIRAYAREVGVGEEELIEAFRDVPVMPREQFDRVARMLEALASQLSNSAYQNVQQARFINDLKRAEEQLLVSTERLATVMDSMDAIVSIADMETHDLLFLNEYGRKVCGEQEGTDGWRAMQGLGGADPVCTKDMLVGADGKPSGPYHWEHEDTVNDRFYEVRVCAVEWTDGRLVRMGVATDITDRKQAEVERERLEAKLLQAQKLESIGQLAGGVAHDFNNMLGVILGYTELALGQLTPAQPLYEELQEIHKAAERTAALTRQLLGFARKQTIVPRVLDLNETVEGMLQMIGHMIGEDIDLEWQPGEQLGAVKMDPSQIEQILVSLCINSRDALSGGGRISIETSEATFDEESSGVHEEAEPGTYARLTVQDNGCGMDPETLSRIFEPFFTTKDISQGAGLGLPTVYGIVRQNNGFVHVESEPGKGTSVHVYMPIHAAKAAAESGEGGGAARPALNETILLVEDDASLLTMTTSMLERRGYRVLAANSPGAALQLAIGHPGEIDLLMTDMIMPEMSGHDLAQKLKTIQPGLKQLFMSGHSDAALAQRGMLNEGGHFIQKPFSMKELVNSIIETLNDRSRG